MNALESVRKFLTDEEVLITVSSRPMGGGFSTSHSVSQSVSAGLLPISIVRISLVLYVQYIYIHKCGVESAKNV